MTNNFRIAKNTIMLYIRMLFSMLVSLYTSRIVLNTLGVEDYGVYNVVGGIVAMFSFLNGAMASGTQRFFTFELGRKDMLQLSRVFSMSMTIHLLIIGIIFIFAETIGFWFVNTQLTIPPERLSAANWVYQLSVLSAMVSVWSVPYNAAIIAHERMNVYAYVSIVEVTLRLLIVFLLQWLEFDKLKLYAILAFSVSLIVRYIYGAYSNKHFAETKYRFYWNKEMFKSLVNYAGWNLWGNLAVVTMDQGINILLNIFFGPAVNAARAISFSVKAAVNSFVQNFQVALNPQIIKSYAADDLKYMHQLIFQGAKFSFFLLYIISLPVLIETETILKLWLKIVPNYAVIFTRLIIVNILIDCISGPLMTAAQATGKIKKYQIVVGGLLLLNLPFSYLFLKLGFEPESTFYISIFISILALYFRLTIISPLVNMSMLLYFKNVVYRIIPVVIFSFVPLLLIRGYIFSELNRFIIIGLFCLIFTCILVYFIGLNYTEKSFLQSKIIQLIKRKNRK